MFIKKYGKVDDSLTGKYMELKKDIFLREPKKDIDFKTINYNTDIIKNTEYTFNIKKKEEPFPIRDMKTNFEKENKLLRDEINKLKEDNILVKTKLKLMFNVFKIIIIIIIIIKQTSSPNPYPANLITHKP